MSHDDERAKAGEGTGESNHAVVDGADTRALSSADFNAVAHNGRAEPIGALAKCREHSAFDRPIEVATEGDEGQLELRYIRTEAREGSFEVTLGLLELADVSSRNVSAPIEVLQEAGVRVDGALQSLTRIDRARLNARQTLTT